MKACNYRIASFVFSAIIVLGLSFTTGCSIVPADTDLQSAYRNAIADAEIAEPDEICRNLEAIVDYNPDLSWEGQLGQSRVMLVTWTGWDGYNENIGETMPAGREIWVVIPGELRSFYTVTRNGSWKCGQVL